MTRKRCNLCKADMHFHHDIMLCDTCDTLVITQMIARVKKDA